MEKSNSRKSKLIVCVLLAVLITALSLVIYFCTRPDIKSIKFSSIEYKNNFTYVYVNVEARSDDAEIFVKDFTIYSDGLPVSASQIFNGKIGYYPSYKMSQDNDHLFEVILAVQFDLSKEELDKPIKISYKGKSIVN